MSWSAKCYSGVRMKRFAVLVLSLILVKASFAQPTANVQRQFEDAARKIVRLQPTAFRELPPNVIGELQRRGCTIPQEAYTKRPHNVVKGEFARPGQTDWAVLCSIKGVSTILVFWNGSEKAPAQVASREDRIFLQTFDSTASSFCRGISPVGKDFIVRHHDAYGGQELPPLDHQGIDDAFIEKASVTWYFHQGKWLKLPGAD